MKKTLKVLTIIAMMILVGEIFAQDVPSTSNEFDIEVAEPEEITLSEDDQERFELEIKKIVSNPNAVLINFFNTITYHGYIYVYIYDISESQPYIVRVKKNITNIEKKAISEYRSNREPLKNFIF